MSSPESIEVAGTLKYLADAVQPVERIDDGYFDNEISPQLVVMTSIGTRKKAVITPAFPGMQFKWDLNHRISMSGLYNRPFAEAVVGYSRRNKIAAVTLRVMMLPHEKNVLETAWLYDISSLDTPPSTTWDVVDGINQYSGNGYPIRSRSGLVPINDSREKNHNWSVSNTYEPGLVASEVHDAVSSRIDFHYF